MLFREILPPVSDGCGRGRGRGRDGGGADCRRGGGDGRASGHGDHFLLNGLKHVYLALGPEKNAFCAK